MYGPSPRAWGSGPPRPHPRRHRRSIPTCVGLGATPPAHRVAAAVHPHVRGARDGQGIRTGSAYGPSPQTWRSAGPRRPKARAVRSLPTCVGLGVHPQPGAQGAAVHPHVRGARIRMYCRDCKQYGPSPRAWGSGIITRDSRTRHRSIPTCVGLGLPDLRKLSPLPICNQNYRSDTRTCNNTVTLCGCPYSHGYSPTLTPAYAQHWLAALTTNQPRTQPDVRNTVTRYSSTIIHPD